MIGNKIFIYTITDDKIQQKQNKTNLKQKTKDSQ